MILLICFFAFASFFYILGVKRLLENEYFFERIEKSKYFNKNTKNLAKFTREKSIAPFFGLFILLSVIVWCFIPFKTQKNLAKQQRHIDRMIVFKLLEINMVSTPHFYIVSMLFMVARLLISAIYLLLTTNIKSIFNGFSKLADMILDDTNIAINKLYLRIK